MAWEVTVLKAGFRLRSLRRQDEPVLLMQDRDLQPGRIDDLQHLGNLEQLREGRAVAAHQPQHADLAPGRPLSWPRSATAGRDLGFEARDDGRKNVVLRIWRAIGLQPHRQGRFKLSEDPQFIERVHGIRGLYLNPPVRAVLLVVDDRR
jgi:hypothetical protein